MRSVEKTKREQLKSRTGGSKEKKKTKTLHSVAHLAFSVWVSTKKAESISINKNPNDCKLEHLPWGVLQSVQHFNDLRSRIFFFNQSLNKRTFSEKLEQTSELNQVSRTEETIGGFVKLSVKLPCTLSAIRNSKKQKRTEWLYLIDWMSPHTNTSVS